MLKSINKLYAQKMTSINKKEPIKILGLENTISEIRRWSGHTAFV